MSDAPRLLQTTKTLYGPNTQGIVSTEAIAGIEVTTSPPAESSVEITTDSKGVPKPTVKVYHTDPAEALRQALELYAQARIALGI